MECRFAFCIYHRENQCILGKMSVNELGVCDDCMPVSLDRQMLEKEKTRQFEELEKRYEQAGM